MNTPTTLLDKLIAQGKGPQYRGDEPRSFYDRHREDEAERLRRDIQDIAAKENLIHPDDVTPQPPAKRRMPRTLEQALKMAADPVGDGIKRTFTIGF